MERELKIRPGLKETRLLARKYSRINMTPPSCHSSSQLGLDITGGGKIVVSKSWGKAWQESDRRESVWTCRAYVYRETENVYSVSL